jgi:hypothetical protein
MTPIAAYYIYVANENERAAASAHKQPLRRHRPSLLDRILSRVSDTRAQPSLPRPA